MSTDAVSLAVALLKVDEGYRSLPYKDSQGNSTIGYGFCISAGLSKPVAQFLLQAQVTEIYNSLSATWWWAKLDPTRASAILDVAFNVGTAGLIHFPKMLTAVGAADWQGAHDELLNSDAARLNVDRYKRLAQILLLGAPMVAQT